ncbi:MAG: DUF1705 domain-containing protein [Candidatus Latescibacteria bacterium]|nr:DUF1705 domain-containing protein [Candidatus Latescibacterota bacterium]
MSLGQCRKLSPMVTDLFRRALWSPSAGFLLFFSIVFTSAFNGVHFRLFSAEDNLLLVLATVRSALSVLWLFALLSLNRHVFVSTVPILCGLSACVAYFTATFGFYLNENTIALVFETNAHETLGVLSGQLILFVLAALAAAGCLSLLFVHRFRPPSLRGGVELTMIAVLANWVVRIPQGTRSLTEQILPLSLFAKSFIYLREQRTLDQLLKTRQNLADLPSTFEGEDLVVVLIIGESARSDHFHINGYVRPTSPRLEERAALAFPGASSLESLTRYALPCMFTRSSPSDLRAAYRETSFISIFRKHGFWTEWISNQGRFWAVLKNRNRAFTHERLFHSVLHCAGITSEAVDLRLSLCGDG